MNEIIFIRKNKNPMNLDKEVGMLQQKIDEQDSILAKLKNEEEKLNIHILEFKEAMKKKAAMNAEAEKNPQVDSQKMSKQLEKQIQNANIMLKNYQNELKAVQKRSNKVKTDDLATLQQNLKEKENTIKRIKEEIKDLQFVKRKQQKLIDKKMKEQDGGKLTKLIEEVRKNKEALQKMEERYQQREQNLKKKKEHLQELEKKYREKCARSGETPMSFQEFKEKKKQRKREDQSVSRQKIKKPQSVKQIINSQLPLDKIQYNQKTLKELRMKKDVAETSLKNGQKKHEKEIEELTHKLEELQKENESLNTRLMEKKKEREIAQSGYLDYTKNLSTKTTRKLTPIK